MRRRRSTWPARRWGARGRCAGSTGRQNRVQGSRFAPRSKRRMLPQLVSPARDARRRAFIGGTVMAKQVVGFLSAVTLVSVGVKWVGICGEVFVGRTALAQFAAPGQPSTKNGEWPHYNGDLRGSRYSPLDQINASNISKLQVAWRFKTDAFGPFP